jgi:aryl-alcohol dehydrogenase-like predicted oxidoreductase
MLGRALGKRRHDVVVATKVHAPTGAGRNDMGLSRLHIIRALEDSLRRLGTDYIDLYQLHNFDPATPMEETLRALVHDFNAFVSAQVNYSLVSRVSAQVNYSLVSRDAEREILPMARAQRLAVTVWSPLADGFLTGKIGRHSPTAPGRRETGGDFRQRHPRRPHHRSAHREHCRIRPRTDQ